LLARFIAVAFKVDGGDGTERGDRRLARSQIAGVTLG
jgi:hypothetical protein